MALRDFPADQLQYDFSAICEQAGLTFSYLGSTVTGVWNGSSNDFSDFEDQRRGEVKYAVFFTLNQVTTTPQLLTTLVRAGVTYFVERISFDAEGVGCQIDVCKQV